MRPISFMICLFVYYTTLHFYVLDTAKVMVVMVEGSRGGRERRAVAAGQFGEVVREV